MRRSFDGLRILDVVPGMLLLIILSVTVYAVWEHYVEATPFRVCTAHVITGIDTIPSHVQKVGSTYVLFSAQVDTTVYCNRWIDAEGQEIDEDGTRITPYVSHRTPLKVER